MVADALQKVGSIKINVGRNFMRGQVLRFISKANADVSAYQM
jgi:hypothetical protein